MWFNGEVLARRAEYDPERLADRLDEIAVGDLVFVGKLEWARTDAADCYFLGPNGPEDVEALAEIIIECCAAIALRDSFGADDADSLVAGGCAS